ncbi:hypothetical protein K492DRAFT_192404 [Lichtheimia hyalospora FSU 10163]|nr:hypothetical protein K492DRAFT_192404 [Lichtheimia hyalospora FSU 10163]
MALVTSCIFHTNSRASHDSDGSLESLSTANHSIDTNNSCSNKITSLGIVRLEHVMNQLLQTSTSTTSSSSTTDTCIRIMDEKTNATPNTSNVTEHRLLWNNAEQPDQVAKSTITCSSKASSETVISKS